MAHKNSRLVMLPNVFGRLPVSKLLCRFLERASSVHHSLATDCVQTAANLHYGHIRQACQSLR